MKRRSNKNSPAHPKPHTYLWYVGVWATWWWAISGIYLAILVWTASPYYIAAAGYIDSILSARLWWQSTTQALHNSVGLQLLGCIILLVWIIGAVAWLDALKKSRISYRAGFKDLFGSIR